MDVITQPALPGVDAVGRTQYWTLPTDDGESVVEIYATFLGVASSHRAGHFRHPADRFAPAGDRCAACRWFEPRIFRELIEGDHEFDPVKRGRYLVHFAGRSAVPGETTRSRHEWLDGPHEVVEALTTRRVASNEVFLTPPAARVLAQAAGWDRDLELAYVDRAVS